VYLLSAAGGRKGRFGGCAHQPANIRQHQSNGENQESVGHFGPNRQLHCAFLKSISIAKVII
jgi:hypothetical protein